MQEFKGFKEFQFLYRIPFYYTFPIKVTSQTPDDNIGAGVLIDVGGRVMVATAAHVIQDNPAVLDLDFVLPPKPAVSILRRGLNKSLDIGFLELERNPHIKSISRGMCTLGMICLDAPPTPSSPFFVVGFPEVHRKRNGNQFTLVEKGFGTTFLAKDGDGTFRFDFPKEGNSVNYTTGELEAVQFDKKPDGYSGGGYWGFLQEKAGEIFNPENHVKLFAIQSAWLCSQRYVRCVPMIHWLKLVYDKCTDLQGFIMEAFPRAGLSEGV